MDDEFRRTAALALIENQYIALRNEIVERIRVQHQLVSFTLAAAAAFIALSAQHNTPASAILLYPLVAAGLATGFAHNDSRVHLLGRFIRERIEEPLLSQFAVPHHVRMDKEPPKRRPRILGFMPRRKKSAANSQWREASIGLYGWEHSFSSAKRRGFVSARHHTRMTSHENRGSTLGDRALSGYAKWIFLSTQILAMSLGIVKLRQTTLPTWDAFWKVLGDYSNNLFVIYDAALIIADIVAVVWVIIVIRYREG
jgi:hypothetical protein